MRRIGARFGCVGGIAPITRWRPARSRRRRLAARRKKRCAESGWGTRRGESRTTDQPATRRTGWGGSSSDRNCKIAAAEARGAAEEAVRGIRVGHTAGRISYNGPAGDSADWMAVFLIHAPRDASLDLEARNGPIEVRGVNGSVKLRATNGPIAIADCGGNVEAHPPNGPIAFSGERGEVHLTAQNGPIALHFAKETWNGSQLEARTINGPMEIGRAS